MYRDFAERYSEFEDHHWWFRGRRKVLRALMEDLDWRVGLRVLEIGVGSGTSMQTLYPEGVEVYGLEPDVRNAEIARRRTQRPVYVGALERLPEEVRTEPFDVVTLFDVLEHLPDDVGALRRLRELLRPEGKLVLTVPAYMWLWSRHDVVNEHYRRYTARELARKLGEAGYRVCRVTYFNTLMLIPIAVFRWVSNVAGQIRPPKPAQRVPSDFEFRTGPLDTLWACIFALEAPWLRRWNLPAGVSVFGLAQRGPG